MLPARQRLVQYSLYGNYGYIAVCFLRSPYVPLLFLRWLLLQGYPYIPFKSSARSYHECSNQMEDRTAPEKKDRVTVLTVMRFHWLKLSPGVMIKVDSYNP